MLHTRYLNCTKWQQSTKANAEFSQQQILTSPYNVCTKKQKAVYSQLRSRETNSVRMNNSSRNHTPTRLYVHTYIICAIEKKIPSALPREREWETSFMVCLCAFRERERGREVGYAAVDLYMGKGGERFIGEAVRRRNITMWQSRYKAFLTRHLNTCKV